MPDNPIRNLNEYLLSLEEARNDRMFALSNYEELCARYKEVFRPLFSVPDGASLDHLYAKCPSGTGYPRSHIFICAALLLYAPSSLFGDKIPLALAKQLAYTLGAGHSAVYNARNKVSSWLRIYVSFRRAVAEVVDLPDR